MSLTNGSRQRAALASLLVPLGLLLGACHGHDGHEGPTHFPGANEPLPTAAVGPHTAEHFAARPPPFSEGIFPCSRCHEGGPDDPAPEGAVYGHASHLEKGLDCEDCHEFDDAGEPTAADPEFCFECHEDLEDGPPNAKLYFEQTRRDDDTYAFGGRWTTGDVIANHAGHADAEVGCVACHGEITNAAVTKPRSVTLMDRCTTCHAERGAPSDCKTCHRETTDPPHADIRLDHAEDQRGCLDCHDWQDRDVLHLANGSKVRFDESYRLCGQCHGPKLRDWKVGLHGKRIGSWSGEKEYLLCAHCHNPHAPGFRRMKPLERPARPEEIR